MEWIVRGYRLDLIPNDAVAVPSGHNDAPLENRIIDDPSFFAVITARNESSITFKSPNAVAHSQLYLGGILTNDREEVLWVNDSQPLP